MLGRHLYFLSEAEFADSLRKVKHLFIITFLFINHPVLTSFLLKRSLTILSHFFTDHLISISSSVYDSFISVPQLNNNIWQLGLAYYDDEPDTIIL